MAGDIGHPFRRTYYQFLKWCSSKYKHVLLIPGNREYYGSSIKKCRKKLKELSKATGVTILDRDTYEDPECNFVILGVTLWTDVPESRYFDELMKNDDYRCIEDFDLNVSSRLHQEDKEWLSETVNFYSTKNPEYKIIVATHHPPEYQHTISLYDRERKVYDDYPDCRDVMNNVYLWIYGHTHYNSTCSCTLEEGEKVIVTSNQRGFPGEIIGYVKDNYILIDSSNENEESIDRKDT